MRPLSAKAANNRRGPFLYTKRLVVVVWNCK